MAFQDEYSICQDNANPPPLNQSNTTNGMEWDYLAYLWLFLFFNWEDEQICWEGKIQKASAHVLALLKGLTLICTTSSKWGWQVSFISFFGNLVQESGIPTAYVCNTEHSWSCDIHWVWMNDSQLSDSQGWCIIMPSSFPNERGSPKWSSSLDIHCYKITPI